MMHTVSADEPRRADGARILFVTLAPFPSSRAPVIQVANMAQAFAELGHEVSLVAPAPAAERSDQGPSLEELFGFAATFSVVVLARRVRRGQSYTQALRIARRASRERVDLVFSRNLRACLLPALRGVPTVFEAHTLTALDRPQERWVLRRLLRAPGLRGIVAISSGLAEDLVDHLAVPADRVLVAHDAVRLDESESRGAPRAPGGRLRVGYTGSLYRGRGVEMLLEIAAGSPWLELHLVGGPDEVARELAVEQHRGGREANVVIHGPVTPAEARRLQSRFDVLVAPFARSVMTDSGIDSSRWMSPMKVFEYMASGRPIVISDLPVLREVLRPDVDALMVTPEDPEALATALRRLADDPELGNRLAASALERARTEFTWELRARRILERFVPEATGHREHA